MNRIFLGGTCAQTTWRDELIEKMSRDNYEAEWFNPVVKNWTPECQENEENEKNNKCNVHLYVITYRFADYTPIHLVGGKILFVEPPLVLMVRWKAISSSDN